MNTNDAPFGWRHALGCGVIIAGTTLALVLMCSSAHAGAVDCTPKGFGDLTGTSSARGKWGAWRCSKGINIVACSADTCTDAVLNAAWWVVKRGATLADANSALTKYGAGGRCDPAVRAVWWPDRYALKQDLGASDAEIAALCPAQ